MGRHRDRGGVDVVVVLDPGEPPGTVVACRRGPPGSPGPPRPARSIGLARPTRRTGPPGTAALATATAAAAAGTVLVVAGRPVVPGIVVGRDPRRGGGADLAGIGPSDPSEPPRRPADPSPFAVMSASSAAWSPRSSGPPESTTAVTAAATTTIAASAGQDQAPSRGRRRSACNERGAPPAAAAEPVTGIPVVAVDAGVPAAGLAVPAGGPPPPLEPDPPPPDELEGGARRLTAEPSGTPWAISPAAAWALSATAPPRSEPPRTRTLGARRPAAPRCTPRNRPRGPR